MRTTIAVCTLFVSAALMACGGSTSNDPGDAGDQADAGGQPDSNVTPEADVPDVAPPVDAGYPGPHPAPPQVQSYGGAVLGAPNVIPVFFPNDPFQTQIESFLGQLPGSSYWKAVTGEYGVGDITVGTSIVVTDTAPAQITPSAIESWISGHFASNDPAWPPIAKNNVYVVFYPSGTVISDQQLGTSCNTFGGYHDEGKGPNASSFIYAVLPRCANFGSLTGVDSVTAALSHELIEAATDPAVYTDPAYALTDPDHFVWSVVPLGEVGDMCAYEPQSYQRLLGNFVVQRTWSNKSAKAGHDPCVPALPAPYFNAAPVLTDAVNLDYYGQTMPTKGIQIPIGQSKTIDVQLFSDAPTGAWTVQAVDTAYFNQTTPELKFSFDKQNGQNGDTLHLTITRLKAGSIGGTEFALYSQKGAGNANLWFGFVAN